MQPNFLLQLELTLTEGHNFFTEPTDIFSMNSSIGFHSNEQGGQQVEASTENTASQKLKIITGSWKEEGEDGDFISFNDNGMDVLSGRMRLFKLLAPSNAASTLTKSYGPKDSIKYSIRYGSGSVVCVLAIPSYMCYRDFLLFIGRKVRDSVLHFRFLQYEILLM